MVEFYNKRRTAEQWIKEGKIALTGTRLSCQDFMAEVAIPRDLFVAILRKIDGLRVCPEAG